MYSGLLQVIDRVRGDVRRRAAFCLVLVLCTVAPSWASRVLQDETGRKVTVPDRPQRVVSLTPSITNTIYALGGASQLAAITDYTTFPPEARKQKPSIGDILRPSLERIAALRPDVVIAMSTLNSPDTLRSLERIGIPVFLVTGQDLAGLYRSIDSIGRVLAREKEAKALAANLRAREQRVRAQAKGVRPSVLLLLSIHPCITAGRSAFISEMIAAAGARSVTEDIQQSWIRLSVESLLPRKPDFLLALMDAPFAMNDLKSQPGWNQLEAVRRGRIIRVDDRLQVPGPVAFDGLEEFARQLRAATGRR